MQKEFIYAFVGVFISYLLLRYFLRHNKTKDVYTEVITSEEYKVKGQWDK